MDTQQTAISGVRWYVNADLGEVMKIDVHHSGLVPITAFSFRSIVKCCGAHCLVYEENDSILAYLLFCNELRKRGRAEYKLISVQRYACVEKDQPPLPIFDLFSRLERKTNQHHPAKAVVRVKESDLALQQRLKSHGWRCDKIDRHWFSDEVAYRFIYWSNEPMASCESAAA